MINEMLGNMVNAPEPKVGEFCTELSWSDRAPFTITKVVSAKEIEVVADLVKWGKEGGREMGDHRFWVMESDPAPEGKALTLVKGRDGKWRRKGEKGKAARIYAMGRREYYRDDSF